MDVPKHLELGMPIVITHKPTLTLVHVLRVITPVLGVGWLVRTAECRPGTAEHQLILVGELVGQDYKVTFINKSKGGPSAQN